MEILFHKKDDLYPISFGGNKAGKLFIFSDIASGDYDCVIFIAAIVPIIAV